MIKRLLLPLLVMGHLNGITLKQFRTYTESIPESAELPYSSFLLNPDYSAWYRSAKPSFFTSFFERVMLHQPAWSTRDFTQLLMSLTEQRLSKRLAKPHSLFLKPKPMTRIIVIGPLYGSFRSLVRMLDELYRIHVIDDNFTLIKQDTFLVFQGNIPHGSPYNLEILSLVMALMNANPDRVVYLAGDLERHDTWRGYTLKKEISERIGASYEKYMTRFFNTLPQALFIESPSGREDIIRIGDRASCVSPQSLPQGKLVVCPSSAIPMVSVKTILVGEKRMMNYSQHGGLVLAPAQEGALTWALFSAPNRLYKEQYSFNYDAFTILSIGENLSSSVISLYHQDPSKHHGFIHAARHLVRTGKRLEAPPLPIGPHENRFIPSKALIKRVQECREVSDLEYSKQEEQLKKKESIYIGCTLDLTKGASPAGKRLRDGIALCINEVNARGGIKGRPIKMVFMDDEYSPEKARINVEQFIIKYKSSLFLGNQGSPTLQAYLPLLKEKKLFLFFPRTGAPLFRQKDVYGIIHWRASYKAEAQLLTQYMINTFRTDSFGFLYQNDAYGLGALEGANPVAKKAGISKIVEAKYERNTTSFVHQIQQIKEGAVNGLGFFSTPLAAMEFIRQAGAEFFIGKRMFGLSDLADESFEIFARQLGLDFVLAEFVPNPKTSSMPLVKEFRQVLRKQGILQPDVFMLEGYIGASLTVHILNKAYPDFSFDSINKVISTIKGDYKGLPLSFDPETRELAHLLWLNTGSSRWIRQQENE